VLDNWASAEEYLVDCPYRDEIELCRKWISDIGATNCELAACLYSCALRQLKYDDTDKNRAIALINTAFMLYKES
jgi:hypothetical protein